MRFKFATVGMIAIVSGLLSVAACGDRATANVRYVSAPSGLVLRQSPAANGQRVQLIPYATEVKVLEEQAQSETIGDRQGKWTRVNHAGTVGWVFGAYLSASAPGSAERRCYSVASETFDGKIDLRLFPGDVKGELIGTVHDEEAGYFTGYKSTLNGTRAGDTLKLRVVTSIENDVQKNDETWKLAGGTLTTPTHTYSQKDCAKLSFP